MSGAIKNHIHRHDNCFARSLELILAADASIQQTTQFVKESHRLILRSRELLEKSRAAAKPDAAHD
jgi:hypothetical protein